MSFRRTCPVCEREFWHPHHMNYHRENLTCSPECRLKQRVKRTRERRYRARMARLEAAAKKLAARQKPKRGTVRRPRQLSITKKHAQDPKRGTSVGIKTRGHRRSIRVSRRHQRRRARK